MMSHYKVLDKIYEIISLGVGCVVTDNCGRQIEFLRHTISLSGWGNGQEVVGETPMRDRRWKKIREIDDIRET